MGIVRGWGITGRHMVRTSGKTGIGRQGFLTIVTSLKCENTFFDVLEFAIGKGNARLLSVAFGVMADRGSQTPPDPAGWTPPPAPTPPARPHRLLVSWPARGLLVAFAAWFFFGGGRFGVGLRGQPSSRA